VGVYRLVWVVMNRWHLNGLVHVQTGRVFIVEERVVLVVVSVSVWGGLVVGWGFLVLVVRVVDVVGVETPGAVGGARGGVCR
jgi:hypothetical protein